MKRAWFRIRFFLPVMGCLFLLSACGGEDGGGATTARRPAPNFALKELDGGILRLDDLHGKVVLINFFATWCSPCRQEVPDFIRLRRKFADEGFEIVGIGLDMEGAAVLGPFARHYNINYPIVVGTREVVTDYGGIEGVPTTFFVDRKGFIANRVIGFVPSNRLEKMIEKLL